MTMDYSNVCFVIMPFGRKKVGEQEVDEGQMDGHRDFC